jgi:Uma2 family endonuclease
MSASLLVPDLPAVAPSVAPSGQSAADLVEVPDGYELVNGQLMEMNVGAESAWVSGNLFILLGAHNNKQQLGFVLPSETVYRCFPKGQTARKPDASFVRKGQLKDDRVPAGDMKIAPDLVIESVSPNDTVYELDEKVEQFLAAGVRLVWVINPKARIAIVHRADGSMAKVREGQDLDGEDVVQGFRCSLTAILPPPKVETNGEES